MRFAWLLTVCVLTVPAAAQEKKPATEPAAPTVRVFGLTVEKPIPGERSMPQSTQIKLFVKCPGKNILGLDHDKSSLASLADDKNTDLTKGSYPALDLKNNEIRRLGDGDSGLLYLHLPGAPVPEARRIKLKGTMALICGTNVKQTEAKKLALKKGEELKLGPVHVKVTEAGNGYSRFSYESPAPIVKKIEVMNDMGKQVQTSDAGGYVPLVGAYKRPVPSMMIFDKLESVTLKISYFDATEVVTIPLDLDFGIGLEP